MQSERVRSTNTFQVIAKSHHHPLSRVANIYLLLYIGGEWQVIKDITFDGISISPWKVISIKNSTIEGVVDEFFLHQIIQKSLINALIKWTIFKHSLNH